MRPSSQVYWGGWSKEREKKSEVLRHKKKRLDLSKQWWEDRDVEFLIDLQDFEEERGVRVCAIEVNQEGSLFKLIRESRRDEGCRREV